jgi:dihydrofolate synthase/folylpolyglutamate synthase
MTYAEAIQFLYHLGLFGAKLGLENTFRLAELAGKPQDALRFIHVAGTNGKGSTCAMLESIYRRTGLRVGLFTSPHLVAFGERIQVNRQPMAEADIIRLVSEMQSLMTHFDEPAHPTFFEVVTVMALRYFAEQRCDLVIWETGLGGRLDATNIVSPLASVITNVQLDHQQWLGESLAQIAGEKAGIIKPRTPVITTTDVPAALDVIRQTAREKAAPLTIVARSEAHRPPLAAMQLPLRGDHQRLNAALALATVRALDSAIPVTDKAIRQGLEQVCWSGRFQVETTTSGQTFLLDGAHNPAGAGTLRATLREHFPQAQPTLILGVLRDKDWTTMCEILAPLARRILLVPVHSGRTALPEELKAVCHQVNPQAMVEVCSALPEALAHAANDPFIVLAGSLYLVGEAMERLNLSPASPSNERGLNEWGGVTQTGLR